MAKPSIFSRDYEKKMKIRRRRIFLSILAVVILALGLFIKFEFENIDFSKVRGKIQAWVDSGRPEDLNKDKTDKTSNKEDVTSSKTQKQNKQSQKTYVNLNVSNGVSVKAEYTEVNGVKKFVSIDQSTIPTGVNYSINPSGTFILLNDGNQNLFIFDTSGTSRNVTKTSYTSQAGDVFAKDTVLQGNPSYVWDSQAKFVDDTRIAYVSCLPYFADSAVNSYVWVFDTASGNEECLWNYCGPQVTLGEIVANKGLTMNVNGVVYYVSGDGIVTQ